MTNENKCNTGGAKKHTPEITAYCDRNETGSTRAKGGHSLTDGGALAVKLGGAAVRYPATFGPPEKQRLSVKAIRKLVWSLRLATASNSNKGASRCWCRQQPRAFGNSRFPRKISFLVARMRKRGLDFCVNRARSCEKHHHRVKGRACTLA